MQRGSINVKLLDSSSKIPTRATDGSAGFDLYANESLTIEPWQRALVKTGIAIEIPLFYVGIIKSRSSLGLRGIDIAGGVIDSDYRGDVGVILVNNSDSQFEVVKGDRIAQIIVFAVLTHMNVVSELTITERGSHGFGSTGVK